eukprot:GFYU01015313.1.p1 GENE.GFYU01015313.1~~GFYU01015313.1.p1  ORF type:complete len:615 (+),score=86.10 GFYU01015313.1:108-1952(+)
MAAKHVDVYYKMSDSGSLSGPNSFDDSPTSRFQWLRKSYPYYVLFILTWVYIVAQVDRHLFSAVLEDIKVDLDIDDAQLGFLVGFAFTAFFTVSGLFVGRLADLWSRRNVLTVGLFAWSALTALTAVCTDFWQLTLVRIGSGIGEASCTPAATSLIGDYFRQENRVLAMSVFSSGIYVGVGLGFAVGGVMSEMFGWRVTFAFCGVIGIGFAVLLFLTVREPEDESLEDIDDDTEKGKYSDDEGTRRAEVGTGTSLGTVDSESLAGSDYVEVSTSSPVQRVTQSGATQGHVNNHSRDDTDADSTEETSKILCAGDAGRHVNGDTRGPSVGAVRGSTGKTSAVHSTSDVGDAATTDNESTAGEGLTTLEVAMLLARNRPFVLLCFAAAIRNIAGYSIGGWIATFYRRQHALSASDIDVWYGVIACVGGSVGAAWSGYLIKVVVARSSAHYLVVPALGQLVSGAIFVYVVLTDDVKLSLAGLFVVFLAGETWIGACLSILQDMFPKTVWSTATAVYLFLSTIGAGSGPLFVGVISDMAPEGSLRLGLLSIVPGAYIISGVLFLYVNTSSRSIARGRERSSRSLSNVSIEHERVNSIDGDMLGTRRLLATDNVTSSKP